MNESLRIRVGDWDVAPALNQLERGGRSIRIEPRAMDVLAYLAQRPGQVVSVEELVAAVWKGAAVTDHSVYLAISQIRQALEDGENGRHYIETIRKRGYRLTTPVAPLKESPESRATQSMPAAGPEAADPATLLLANDPKPARSRLQLAAWVVGASAVAVAGVAAFAWLRDGPGSSIPAGPPRVAVLPCDNLSPDPDDTFFAAGIHEEILNRLAQLSGLGVIAGSSVLQYAEARPPIRQIAAELGAAAVMECSVRYANDSVLVTAQLIDPSTDTHLWSDTYGGDRSAVNELFAMQADIATNIAKALNAELSPAEQRRVGRASTDSMQAYAQILQLFDADRRYGPPEALFEYVDRAIEIDPNYAFAYAARGSLHIGSANAASILRGSAAAAEPGSVDAERQRRFDLARENALRALEIDPELGFAHSILGTLSMFTGDLDDARESHERAVALSPGDALVLRNYGLFEIGESRFRQALELLERAQRLDPKLVDSIPYAIAGEFDVARDHALAQIDQNPLNPTGHLALAILDATIFNDAETAERELRLVEQLAHEDYLFFHLTTHLLVVYVYGRLGLVDDARRVHHEVLAALPDEQALTPTARVRAHLAFGEIDEAYEWAGKMVSGPLAGAGAARLTFMHNTFNDPVFERPEFVELRRQLGYAD